MGSLVLYVGKTACCLILEKVSVDGERRVLLVSGGKFVHRSLIWDSLWEKLTGTRMRDGSYTP